MEAMQQQVTSLQRQVSGLVTAADQLRTAAVMLVELISRNQRHISRIEDCLEDEGDGYESLSTSSRSQERSRSPHRHG